MTRLVRRLLLSMSFAFALVLLVLYLAVKASLPPLDGDFPITGIIEDVRLERDGNGVPTVIAKNRMDLAFGTGFAHGQDRFFQMDLYRRRAAGELAALVGPAVVDLDKRNRLHRFRSRAKQVIDDMAVDEADIMGAYVSGVNAGLASLRARPFEYLLLGRSPETWRIEDSVLVIYSMFMQLNDGRASRDIQRGLVHRVLPNGVFRWLYPSGTRWDAPLIGEARETTAVPPPSQLDLRRFVGHIDARVETASAWSPSFGSNNWAVSGRLSGNGRPIVAGDMHLKLTAPNVFYRARLVVNGTNGLDTTGVTLPGTPAVIAGSNGHVAWAFTNSYGDWSDAVLVRAGERPGTYRTPSGDMDFEVHEETIEIAGQAPQVVLVKETIWGPVLDDQDYPDGDLALRWLAHDGRAINMNQLGLESARTVFDALAVANRSGLPPQNFVCGDSAGNIAWSIAGQIPLRASYDASIPADWSEVGGWIGWLSPDDYPRIVNPESGRIWTANARVVDGDELKIIGDADYELGARAMQIRDQLFARDSFEPKDMLGIQLDDRALFLAPWRELLLSILDQAAVRSDARRGEYRDLVATWMPRASPDSVGYRLVRAFRERVQQIVFDGLMAPVRAADDSAAELWISSQFEGPLWKIVQERPPHLLPGGYTDWRALMLQAVDVNIEYFARFEGGLIRRSWGEYNTAAIRHPLSQALPLLSRWLDMPPDPLSGDTHLPKAQGAAWGASARFAVSPGDEAGGYLHMPTGQSGHPLSDYYRAGHEDWVVGRPSAFLPGESVHVLNLRAGN